MYNSPLSQPSSPLPTNAFRQISGGRFTSRRGIIAFFGIAGLSGVLFHLVYIGLLGGGGDSGALKEWLPPLRPTQPEAKIVYEPCPIPKDALPNGQPATTRPHTSENTITSQDDYAEEEEWDIERLRTMVSNTKGYYVRDYSLGLGWNNMRYIIEASLLHATLLNRTLVLPSFIYARSCEWEINACAAFATMVNRGDAIGWDEWRNLPLEKQMGWKIPMEFMLDLPYLRKMSYNVLLVKDYLRLHALSPDIEWSNGAWHRTAYHEGTNPPTTIASIPNGVYDPSGVVRVDTVKTVPKDVPEGKYHDKLLKKMGDHATLEHQEAREVFEAGLWRQLSESELENLLLENGWTVVYTWAGAIGMDYFKAVIEPVRQFAPISRLQGLVDDFDHIGSNVLVLEGETHYGRKPGALRFISVEARDDFARMVLYGFRPVARVRRLADKIAQRMQKKVQGRMWMAAHMRRGDFVGLGWAMEKSLESHFTRIKDRISKGHTILSDLFSSQELKTYEVPEAHADKSQLSAAPPMAQDPFYLATDERTKEGLKYVRDGGAVLANDLITLEDRREFGWSIMITDVLGLVEQVVLSKAFFMYAHGMSSVAGGAANMRAARGADPQSLYVD